MHSLGDLPSNFGIEIFGFGFGFGATGFGFLRAGFWPLEMAQKATKIPKIMKTLPSILLS